MKKIVIFFILLSSISYAQSIILTPSNFTIQMHAGETITKDIIAIWNGNKAINAELNVSIEAKNTDTIGFDVSYPLIVNLRPNTPTKIPITISTKPNLMPDTFYITIKAEANPPRTISFSAIRGSVEFFRIDDIEVSEVTRSPLIWYGYINYYFTKRNITRLSGFFILTFEGIVNVERTFQYWFGNVTLTLKQPVIASLVMENINTCNSLSGDRVFCDAVGYAIISPKGSCYKEIPNGKIFTNCRIGYKINKIDFSFDIRRVENKIDLDGGSFFKIIGMDLTSFNLRIT